MRRLLLTTVVTLGTVLTGTGSGVQAQDTLTVVSWGGAYQEGLVAASWGPAAQKLGITIKEDSLGGLETVRLQVKGGDTTWDVVDLGGNHCIQGSREGLFEALDFTAIDVNGYPDGSFGDHWIGYSFYSSVLAWNTDKVSDPPETWADFWDLEKYPGTRGLYKAAPETMEEALLADGVAKDQVYEVLGTDAGVERAIAKLNEIKDNVIWWDSGAQAAQLLMDGEVTMTSIWGARVNAVIADGGKADYTYNQGVIGLGCWAVPKGAPHIELAMKFIAEASKAEYVRRFPDELGYGAVNPKAFDGVPAEDLQNINSSPENLAKQVIMDGVFWADNATEYGERFDEMLVE